MSDHEITGASAILAAVQSKVGDAFTDKNNAHLKSKYASLGSILDAVRPALREHKCAVAFATEVVQGDGAIPVLRVTAALTADGLADAAFVSRVPYPFNSAWTPQQVNAAITYGKKATLLQLLLITSTEEQEADDDGEQVSAPQEVISPAQVAALRKLLIEAKGNDDASVLCRGFNHESLDEFTQTDFQRAVAGLTKTIEGNRKVAKGGRNE